MIPRLLEKTIITELSAPKNKLLLIYGPRQSGKTTLLTSLKNRLSPTKSVRYYNCDLESDFVSLNTRALSKLQEITRNVDILLIDEAQRLDNPGLTLKIIYDNIPTVRVIATGSSSFQLKNKLSDALTGRYWSYYLYPISFSEIVSYLFTNVPTDQQPNRVRELLDQFQLYGFYPEVLTQNDVKNKQLLLNNIKENYLFKDALSFQHIRYSQALVNLCQALAYQIGSEVNEQELSKRIKIDRKTVISYLDILEQSFIITRVYPYSQNPRREIGRNYKVYFLDLGIRNALIGDFNSLNVRQDIGAVWENFIITERIKKLINSPKLHSYYFWRSYSGAEVDWIEKPYNLPMQAYEIKLSQSKLSKGAYIFSQEYKVPVEIINKDSYYLNLTS
ncbi:MAG: ATP-binding protein [Patescibacteria group bacterium]|nr:ATP-binding protein [Patescibacteria group bacterium]